MIIPIRWVPCQRSHRQAARKTRSWVAMLAAV